jgi:hypothetical protein
VSLLEPDALWAAVSHRLQQRGFLGWLVPVPAVGAFGVALASEFGVRHFNEQWHPVFGYSARPDAEGSRFLVLWIALALAPIVQGLVGAMLLPLYSRPRRWRAALAVAIVGTVPLYVSGLAMVVLPGLVIVLGGFALSTVWWAIAARELLDVPASECAEFVAATLIASSAGLLLFSRAFPFP